MLIAYMEWALGDDHLDITQMVRQVGDKFEPRWLVCFCKPAPCLDDSLFSMDQEYCVMRELLRFNNKTAINQIKDAIRPNGGNPKGQSAGMHAPICVTRHQKHAGASLHGIVRHAVQYTRLCTGDLINDKCLQPRFQAHTDGAGYPMVRLQEARP